MRFQSLLRVVAPEDEARRLRVDCSRRGDESFDLFDDTLKENDQWILELRGIVESKRGKSISLGSSVS